MKFIYTNIFLMCILFSSLSQAIKSVDLIRHYPNESNRTVTMRTFRNLTASDINPYDLSLHCKEGEKLILGGCDLANGSVITNLINSAPSFAYDEKDEVAQEGWHCVYNPKEVKDFSNLAIQITVVCEPN